jgi:hypothetical protein
VAGESMHAGEPSRKEPGENRQFAGSFSYWIHSRCPACRRRDRSRLAYVRPSPREEQRRPRRATRARSSAEQSREATSSLPRRRRRSDRRSASPTTLAVRALRSERGAGRGPSAPHAPGLRGDRPHAPMAPAATEPPVGILISSKVCCPGPFGLLAVGDRARRPGVARRRGRAPSRCRTVVAPPPGWNATT